MKILYYDCFSGISGDMNLGAMIDLGIDKDFLSGELNKLNLKGWELIVQKDQRHGITGTKVTVRQTRHEHAHRHLSDIEKIINDSLLDNNTKELSRKIFLKIAEAEAKVHNMPPDHVHFHEVGAIDSIIDVVGAAICFNALECRWSSCLTCRAWRRICKLRSWKASCTCPCNCRNNKRNACKKEMV